MSYLCPTVTAYMKEVRLTCSIYAPSSSPSVISLDIFQISPLLASPCFHCPLFVFFLPSPVSSSLSISLWL